MSFQAVILIELAITGQMQINNFYLCFKIEDVHEHYRLQRLKTYSWHLDVSRIDPWKGLKRHYIPTSIENILCAMSKLPTLLQSENEKAKELKNRIKKPCGFLNQNSENFILINDSRP